MSSCTLVLIQECEITCQSYIWSVCLKRLKSHSLTIMASTQFQNTQVFLLTWARLLVRLSLQKCYSLPSCNRNIKFIEGSTRTHTVNRHNDKYRLLNSVEAEVWSDGWNWITDAIHMVRSCHGKAFRTTFFVRENPPFQVNPLPKVSSGRQGLPFPRLCFVHINH